MATNERIAKYIDKEAIIAAITAAFRSAEKRALRAAKAKNPSDPIINQMLVDNYASMEDAIEDKLNHMTKNSEKLVKMVKRSKKLIKKQKHDKKLCEILDKNVDKLCEWVTDKQDSLDSIMDNMSLINDAIISKNESDDDIRLSTSSDSDDDEFHGNIFPEVPTAEVPTAEVSTDTMKKKEKVKLLD